MCIACFFKSIYFPPSPLGVASRRFWVRTLSKVYQSRIGKVEISVSNICLFYVQQEWQISGLHGFSNFLEMVEAYKETGEWAVPLPIISSFSHITGTLLLLGYMEQHLNPCNIHTARSSPLVQRDFSITSIFSDLRS